MVSLPYGVRACITGVGLVSVEAAARVSSVSGRMVLLRGEEGSIWINTVPVSKLTDRPSTSAKRFHFFVSFLRRIIRTSIHWTIVHTTVSLSSDRMASQQFYNHSVSCPYEVIGTNLERCSESYLVVREKRPRTKEGVVSQKERISSKNFLETSFLVTNSTVHSKLSENDLWKLLSESYLEKYFLQRLLFKRSFFRNALVSEKANGQFFGNSSVASSHGYLYSKFLKFSANTLNRASFRRLLK